MLASLLLLAALAGAAESPSDWEVMNDARLLGFVRGDYAMASEALEALQARLANDDPLIGEVAYWLAQTRLAQGRVEGAREALRVAEQHAATAEMAMALRSQIEGMQRRILSLPLKTSFEDGANPFVHAWLLGERGSVSVLETGGNSILRWSSVVRDRQDDQMVASFSESAAPLHGLRCLLRSDRFPAVLRVVVTDRKGQEFASEPFTVPVYQWTNLEIRLSELHNTDPTTPRLKPDPRLMSTLALHDVTAYLSQDRGRREVWMDDLEIW